MMFTKAALYDASNNMTKSCARMALQKYFHLLRWQRAERVLDVGSGSGNVTQILAAHLPTDFKLIVGLDVSEEMVKYATENNTDSRITYLRSDIAEVDFQKLKFAFDKLHINTGFDKIFSFTTLHWATNYEQWAKNMFSLLRPGGQVFLMFFAYCSEVELWSDVISSEKWLPYTKDVEHVRFRYHNSEDVDGEVAKVMTDAGFVVNSCAHYTSYTYFKSSDPIYRGFMKAVNPYIHRIPKELQEEYMNDLMKTGGKYQDKFGDPGLPITNVVVVSTKPKK